jgi:hypothetical protein
MNEKEPAKLLRLSGASVQSAIAEGRHLDGRSTRTNPKQGFGFLGPRNLSKSLSDACSKSWLADQISKNDCTVAGHQ